jgi:uncharacterized protein YjbJ (UPF0337 family)
MSISQQKPEWKELKNKIQSKFGKLNDQDLESLNGHMDKLTRTLQRVYSYDPNRAEQECKAFNETLERTA